jgi:hypothetical protein
MPYQHGFVSVAILTLNLLVLAGSFAPSAVGAEASAGASTTTAPAEAASRRDGPTPPAVAADPSPAPTFSADVAPILFDNCVSCHRPGEVAPFTLLTYEDARKRAKTIARVTDDRFMPPWKAEPGHGDFVGVRRLTDSQISTLRAWADAGAPEGDPSQTPAPPKFADGWQLGEPDLVVTMPEPFAVPADGADVYRCFVLPLDLDDDQYVEAVEYRPGNRKVVHHAIFFLDDSGKARDLDAKEPGIGYERMGGPGFTPSGSLGGWAPGYTPERLPPGVARSVKKGSDLVLQVHLHPTGKPESERSTIGIHFAKKPPEKLLISIPRGIRRLDIPAGDADYRIEDGFALPWAAELIGITPHAHLLCREIKVDATLPDGGQRPLIWIRDWDFNWQAQYQYAETVRLPMGTRLSLSFAYDNSAANPAQPSDPPRRVRWGEQTTDEMAIIFFHALIDPEMETLLRGFLQRNRGANNAPAPGNNPGESRPARGGGGFGLLQRALERFDKNNDGTLDPDEQKEALDAVRERQAD